MTIWSPYTNGNGQWIAKNILGGFFAAPIEALPELSVTDVYFAHQRGTYMALYALTLVGSNYIAPVICGWINVGQGYRWVFYWPTIFCAVAFIFMLIFMEETNYDRTSVKAVGKLGSTMIDRDCDPARDSGNDMKASGSGDGSIDADFSRCTTKSFLQKMSFRDTSRPQLMHYRIKQQLAFLFWPNVFYAGFAYGSTLIWFNVLNATASIVFSAPPYNFSSGLVGTTYVACLVGVLLGFLFTGRLSDWFALKMARRNNGISEPEHRLWLFALSSVIIPFALILWGVGAAHHVNWFGLCFAMVSVQITKTECAPLLIFRTLN